jgi:transposase
LVKVRELLSHYDNDPTHLVPREYSSGERQHRGRISKAGGSRARTLLVEAAWALLRWRNAKNQALYDWAMRIAARRGRARA